MLGNYFKTRRNKTVIMEVVSKISLIRLLTWKLLNVKINI